MDPGDPTLTCHDSRVLVGGVQGRELWPFPSTTLSSEMGNSLEMLGVPRGGTWLGAETPERKKEGPEGGEGVEGAEEN